MPSITVASYLAVVSTSISASVQCVRGLHPFNRMPARIGYAKGVPMGGILKKAPAGAAPTFLVAALKGPVGVKLDRIQIVKGWLDGDGNTQEKVYDVVWGGGDTRRIGTNTMGDSEFITVWKDPDFDPTQHALPLAGSFCRVRINDWSIRSAAGTERGLGPTVG